jgi:hypothetical protein
MMSVRFKRVCPSRLLGALAAVMTVSWVCACAAHAESSWWQVTSTPAPSIIKPGGGQDEVQKLAVSAEGGQFVLIETAHFQFKVFPWNATHEEVQAGLEEIYGAGNVEVTGGPGDTEATKPYAITFTGELAHREVPRMTSEPYSQNLLEGARKEAVLTEATAGRSDGEIVLAVTNLGDGVVRAGSKPVTVMDSLPPGVTATDISGAVGSFGLATEGYNGEESVVHCSVSSVACTFAGELMPYERLEIVVDVNVQTSVAEHLENEVEVSGGETPRVSIKRPLTTGDGQAGFGIDSYELYPANEDGSPATQAGSHPFQLSATLNLNTKLERKDNTIIRATEVAPAELTKDLHFQLPPGLIGNPTPLPRCSDYQFSTPIIPSFGIEDYCPDDTAVGIATVMVTNGFAPFKLPFVTTMPLFNLVPAHGEPARFGFYAPGGVAVSLDTYVRTGGDYGVVVHVDNITQYAGFMSSQVTFWGVPGDSRHDISRGWKCLVGGFKGEQPCTSGSVEHPAPFLILPTSCTGPLHTTVEADSWENPGVFASREYTFQNVLGEPFGMDGCNRLSFEPSISLTPDGQAGSTPTGLTVGVHVPQTASLDPGGDAESTVKDTTVALPAGVGLNPAAADGLSSCGLGEIGLESSAEQTCPEASKVGTVEIATPLLPNPLTGAAYLAQQDANPFGSLVALYIVAKDPVSGVLVKLAGQVTPDPVTGQLVSTFKDTPQLPFEDLRLHFFGGSRAPLGTPALCGSYRTVASIAPWSGNDPVDSSSEFQITSGPNGSPCSNPLPFDPSLTTGSTNIQAGAFTPFTMTMSREDGNQNLDAIQLKMPPGLLGTLSSVKLCGEAEGNAGTCGPESLIGHTIVSVGLGSTPFSVTGGGVYITGPYKGAPYGLSIVNPAKAGPFDLGNVIVRAKIEVNPENAALTITSDSTGPYAIPQIIDGIPLQIKHVNVIIDRSDFTFNPTNCSPQAITGGLTSSQGATSALSVPFQVTNCATLGFKPIFKVSTNGKTSRAQGASLSVKLTYPNAPFGSQANIGKVKVDLPKQLPSRLTTLQKACPDSVFNANPASCPANSRIGSATATTPVLPVHLEGPAYFVSHGGAKFPELIVALSGEGVTVYLHGETFINKAGITSSTFRTIPDVPIGTFELKLPQGSDSALAANGNLCTSKLIMPTTFVAANGISIKQSTPITATGCPKHKKAKKTTKHTTKHKKKK